MYEEVLKDEELMRNLTKEMSLFFGGKNCSLVSTGTSALEIALRSLELERGSKVLLPDLSFIATATAVATVGLIPVYGDCTDKYFGITYEEVVKVYSEMPDIKAVIVVHFTGMVNRDVLKIKEFCKENNLYLIEDCAQVFGASIEGKKCGTIGDLGTFSFQKSKILTCGEGGLVIASTQELANKVQALKDWGLDLKEVRQLQLPCGNYRMNQFAAAYLKEHLPQIGELIEARKALYRKAAQLLENKNIKLRTMAEFSDKCHDVPFFILAEADEIKHTLHPLDEYPMHTSKLVRSIIKTYFPDLLDEYERCIEARDYKVSKELVEKTNFIPLFGLDLDSISDVVDGL